MKGRTHLMMVKGQKIKGQRDSGTRVGVSKDTSALLKTLQLLKSDTIWLMTVFLQHSINKEWEINSRTITHSI